MKDILRAPFPWFGGKALAADLVWSRLGDNIKNYIEPFFGSGAILLNAPESSNFVMTVNDIDCYIANFWRAIAADPDEVAIHASHQVNETDLQARHQYLVDNRIKVAELIKENPRYYDAELAGWWAWGCCCWIGGGWCADKVRVNRQLPHLGNKGQGVNRQIQSDGQSREIFLSDWFERLNGKFRNARITCGDWQRICTVSSMLRFGICGVVLDPPYGTTGAVYAYDSNTVANDVRRWCVENGSNPKLRIALCGHVGQHEELQSLGWSIETPKKNGGYQGSDNRERIWFSPYCVGAVPALNTQLSLVSGAITDH